MFFDPLTTWLVVLIGDGIVISNSHASNSRMTQHYKERGKLINDSMNASILKIRDDGYFNAEYALEKIKHHVEYAQNSYAIKHGYAKFEISRESYEFILKLCEECRTNFTEKYELYLKKYEDGINNGKSPEDLTILCAEMEKYKKKTDSYLSIIDLAKKGKSKAIANEEEKKKQLSERNSDSKIILKSLLSIGLCIGGFAIMLSAGGIFGALALIGSAIGSYFILKK